MPKVSIIMPNHNGERYIKDSIQSVLDQTFVDFELIIIDDFSSDNSRQIIDSFSDKRIIKYYSNKNRHVAYTVNIGFAMATGDYIARIDSDDQWASDKLEKQVAFMNANTEYGACFTRVHIIDDDGNQTDEKSIYDLFTLEENKGQKEWLHYFFENGNCLCNPSVLMRKSALERIGKYYNISYVPAQDFELWTRMLRKFPIHILDEKLTYYRWTDSESKISGNDLSSEIAFFNVHTMIKRNFFNDMTDEEFINFFSEDFVNYNSKTNLELEIEKAYLLLNSVKSTNMRWLGLEAFEILLHKEGALELLEKNYNFNLCEYYKLYRNSSLYDTVVKKTLENLETEKRGLEIKIKEDKEYLDFYKTEIEKTNLELKKILNSSSWRLTEPLRKFMKIFRN